MGIDHTEATSPIEISCDRCVARATDACRDCVVSFLVARDPDDALVIDAAELRAVRMLERAGLVPGLRHRRAG